MFWNKKLKLPITPDDKEWVEDALIAIKNDFGEDYFREITTVLPNKKFYDNEFSGSENDALFVLNQTKLYMDIDSDAFALKFFSDQPVTMADGTVLSSPASIDGTWNSAAGIYEETEGVTTIYIERSQLKNPLSLIATVAHELSHYILLGEGRIDENDEYLTDLVAIVYGFGIFLGNSRFTYSSFSNYKESGWQMSSKGYLPEQIIAYAMAWLCVYRNEEREWEKMLNATMLKHFQESVRYIEANPDKIRFN